MRQVLHAWTTRLLQHCTVYLFSEVLSHVAQHSCYGMLILLFAKFALVFIFFCSDDQAFARHLCVNRNKTSHHKYPGSLVKQKFYMRCGVLDR